MRPYLAVIADSFREALASRVLWILLVVITLVLLALVPLGIEQQSGAYLNEEDVLDYQKLIDTVVAAGKAENQPTPGRRIWEELDEGMQRSLAEQPSEPLARRLRELAFLNALRDQMQSKDFYGKVEWQKIRLPAEAQQLLKQDPKNLQQEELARFNRLALEAAFPELIAVAPSKQIQLTYFAWELGIPLPVEAEELYPAINQIVVATLGILLGAFGVFIAVLVTASMIPQAFEAGSVDLLLSKPVWRSGVFLAKFLGGCAFIAINAAYFIVGLWLILGWRLGLWNERLLWVIPLYVFLFAIYYSVSSLAGLVWRNAIVSVVVTIVFWFVCFALGSAVGGIEQLSLNPRRLTKIVPAGESLLAADASELLRWDAAAADWQETFAARRSEEMPFMFGMRLVGPVYDPQGERILAFRSTLPGFAPFGSVNRLLIGKRADEWRRQEGVTVPDGAAGLFVTDKHELLVAASGGVYRLQGDLGARQQDVNVFGIKIPLPQAGGSFVHAGPSVQLRPLRSTARDAQSGAVALFDGHQLAVCTPDAQGKYTAQSTDFERRLVGQVAAGGGATWLALAGGEVRRYGPQLEIAETIDSGINSTPSAAATSPDGRYLAVVFQNARLWLYDTQRKHVAPLEIAGQGDVSAATFAEGKLWVADRVARITEYDLTKLDVDQRWQGPMPLAEKIYRYALYPLYKVFPKPGELNETVNHVLTSGDTKLPGMRFDDERAAVPENVDVWGPVWSNLAFLAVVLLLACAYVYRKDF